MYATEDHYSPNIGWIISVYIHNHVSPILLLPQKLHCSSLPHAAATYLFKRIPQQSKAKKKTKGLRKKDHATLGQCTSTSSSGLFFVSGHGILNESCRFFFFFLFIPAPRSLGEWLLSPLLCCDLKLA